MGYSKNHLPLNRGFLRLTRKRRAAALVYFWLGFLFVGNQAAMAQQNTGDMALRLRPNVVKVQSSNQGNAENGFGFIAGQRAGQLYIVTAQHVIVPNDEPGVVSPTKVRVTFYSDQGKTYDAEVLGTHDTAHDLAVLRLPAPTALPWVKESLGGPDMEKRGVQVWFVGRNSAWFVPVEPGVINSEHPSADWRLEIERLAVRPGSSGAPLISSKGIIGMLQKGNGDDAFALTVDFIRTSMQDWNYPWDLVIAAGNPAPKEEPPTARSCRVAIRSTPTGADVSINGESRGATPTSVELTNGESYKLSVSEEGYAPALQTIGCQTPPVNVSLRSVEPPPAQRETGAITLRYTGDVAYCSLLLNVKIGNKSFVPRGSLFPVTNLVLGNQNYTIQGTISCPLAGTCGASGTGQINVQDGGTFDVAWVNTGIGQCAVRLVPSQ
jgi:hypothetical protein